MSPVPCGREFRSDYSKNGTFTSPGYPEPYPEDIVCIYSFTGKPGERPQILFTDFDLHLPQAPPRDCEGVDAVMVFITINGRRERIQNFCGNKLPAQIMSNGPNMTVEFRSHHSSPEVKGFRAIYRYVTDFGISDTKRDPGSDCTFTFRSMDRNNGTFTSPNYPGLYPRDTECHYYFQGKPNERITIAFDRFDVEGIPPCESQTSSDYVEFSNYKSSVDRKLPRLCGPKIPDPVESDGNFFRVSFKSDDKFDGTGFQAIYRFEATIDPATVKRISSTFVEDASSVVLRQVDCLWIIFAMMVYILLD
ncbi:suppressor of lurcher protein 1-like isoform X2 [Uloborus diversus]|uniref:suppressor of lurcher protein 1-like isoform X2 n=1 Tax=Uloborus diversus TaxID=327109 RepID=UPI002409B240|nr:suppressor of lurcher protein 1-like isoform X2 [Uloborus diversus]